MKHMQKYFWQLLLCAIGIALVWVFFEPAQPEEAAVAATPLSTTYRVEGRLVTLVDGQADFPVAPGSATTVRTRVFGEPVVGDLNNDGQLDAALWLVQEPGGTGTFFYLVAALNTGNGYRGTNAVFVGDRIAPQTVEIRNGLAIANYADRAPSDPFSVAPSIGKSLYAQVAGASLEKITVPETAGVQMMSGFVRYGGEVRTFTPCGEDESLWVIGSSPAYNDIFNAMKQFERTAAAPNTPQFAVLIGSVVPPPTDGFGADYDNAVVAEQLVKFIPGGQCQ